MYSYLRGVYKGRTAEGVVLLEAAGVGYEVIVPPIVQQEIEATCTEDSPLLLHVSAVSSRDQPWPVLFGFLRPREREFWDLLRSIPRVGGKGAARAMAVPIGQIAHAIQEGNKLFLDGLPGVTMDGAEKMVASLRKKVGPFVEAEAPRPTAARRRPISEAEEIQQDAVELLVVMGVKRPEAQRAVEQLLGSREDVTSVQDVITEYFRLQHTARS